ncbi:hypothetical protein QFC22_003009 [Naganishia vaughanmartiniae]|uniref:Uncharacterized protein n=1 Tax=Naganishia vaughanmartiniae TaxID=1424756 RepID=A0ACC2X901_9TREE|nr:hypothetical protein QFC22_003009 [Naganishia vaughanmartiniae]
MIGDSTITGNPDTVGSREGSSQGGAKGSAVKSSLNLVVNVPSLYLEFPSHPTDRVQKLKDARSEAAKEIEAYKTQKQKDYESYEAEHKSQTSTNQHSIDESTETQLADIKKAVEQHRSNVIDKIVERVTQTQPAMHKNLKKIES